MKNNENDDSNFIFFSTMHSTINPLLGAFHGQNFGAIPRYFPRLTGPRSTFQIHDIPGPGQDWATRWSGHRRFLCVFSNIRRLWNSSSSKKIYRFYTASSARNSPAPDSAASFYTACSATAARNSPAPESATSFKTASSASAVQQFVS